MLQLYVSHSPGGGYIGDYTGFGVQGLGSKLLESGG